MGSRTWPGAAKLARPMQRLAAKRVAFQRLGPGEGDQPAQQVLHRAPARQRSSCGPGYSVWAQAGGPHWPNHWPGGGRARQHQHFVRQKGYSGSNDVDLYEQAVAQLRKVQGQGNFKGILWHQGESDQSNAGAYLAKFQQLVADLRQDLGANVPVVAGELGKWRSSSTDLNAVIRSIPASVAKRLLREFRQPHAVVLPKSWTDKAG
ncbi:MAG: sialate O-acetylesterase [Hymenobacter sp.]